MALPRHAPPGGFLTAVLAAVLAVLAAVLVGPGPSAAQSTNGPSLLVAPTCVRSGQATRILILGLGWPDGPVALAAGEGPDASNDLGTATPRVSPVSQQKGSFSFFATVTATSSLEVVARSQQSEVTRSTSVSVQSTCPFGATVTPTCLGGAGDVQVSGAGFEANRPASIIVDPLGDAEAQRPAAQTNASGAFTATVPLPAPKGPIPVLVTQTSSTVVAAPIVRRAVAFVDPCPPPAPTTTSTTRRPAQATTTTAARQDTTTTSVTVPPGVPPEVPPATVPGTPIQVSIFPNTVRPGRCAVLAIAAAPPGAPVVARFADGPNVNAQTGPDGRAVVSVCVPHSSGNLLGPVDVVVTIGAFGPAPLFRVLRVPARPQPPLLQASADGRRS